MLLATQIYVVSKSLKAQIIVVERLSPHRGIGVGMEVTTSNDREERHWQQ